MIIGGDGRFYNQVAFKTILRMAAAHGVAKIITGVNALISTPCVSYLIRSLKAYGAFILTASHNPGGEHEDFGIKYNAKNGGPAPEQLTDLMYQQTQIITEYKITKEFPEVALIICIVSCPRLT